MYSRIIPVLIALCLAAPAAHAVGEWPQWALLDPMDTENPRSAVGSFLDGRSVIATLNVSSFRSSDIFTTVPVIPAAPATYILAPTGVPQEMILTDDVIAIYDLTEFPVDGETTFGLADMVAPASYRLQILDALGQPLALDDVTSTHYNVFYDNGLVADFDVILDPATGLLSVNQVHDANTGSTYVHSGLTLFGNLPTEAEMIRILSGQDQLSEGVQWYFGGNVPVPGAVWLFLGGLAALSRFRRPRR
ncbi:MAG: hypothetical protein QNJ73_03140 [Gammaproteobacteria bacterium]|nr:hypothetical protein [Gammaproteobacteria bacterium]